MTLKVHFNENITNPTSGSTKRQCQKKNAFRLTANYFDLVLNKQKGHENFLL